MCGSLFRQLVRSYPVYSLACNVHTRLSTPAAPNRCRYQQVSRLKSFTSLLVSKSWRSQVNSTSNGRRGCFIQSGSTGLGNVDQLKA